MLPMALQVLPMALQAWLKALQALPMALQAWLKALQALPMVLQAWLKALPDLLLGLQASRASGPPDPSWEVAALSPVSATPVSGERGRAWRVPRVA